MPHFDDNMVIAREAGKAVGFTGGGCVISNWACACRLLFTQPYSPASCSSPDQRAMSRSAFLSKLSVSGNSRSSHVSPSTQPRPLFRNLTQRMQKMIRIREPQPILLSGRVAELERRTL